MVTIRVDRDLPDFARNEAGNHRVQRVPPTERRGRVHTSSVSVAVLVGNQQADTPFDQRSEDDFSYRWFSGTGCGGQHRNKHQNCLELTHTPTGLKKIANGRSRESNSRDAMADMIKLLDEMKSGAGHQAQNDIRASQIGSGMRGDKRRTYRFQDDSIHDHETGRKASCRQFMRGDVERLW